MRNFMTSAEIAQIKEAAAQGKTNKEIGEALGVPASSVGYYAKEVRCGRIAAKRTLRCPECGGKLPDVAGMAFCPFCAADVSTEEQKAARDLSKMLNDITHFYPQERRDFAVQAINKAIKVLKKER